MSETKVLTNPEDIRCWAEERGGRPARVKATAGKDGTGILRLDFGEPDEGLEAISWDDFFEAFEERDLGLLCSSEPENRFNKFIDRS